MTILIKKRYEVLRRPGRARRKPPPRPGPIERFDDGRFVRIERDIAELKADASELKRDAAEAKADLRLIKWMLGFALALISAVLLKLVLV